MDADRFARADALFSEALDRPAGEREAFVRERCGEDGSLTQLVLELLACAAEPEEQFLRPGQPLEGAIWQRASARIEGAVGPGAVIGNWTVLREIGTGGMATVYLARRNDAGFEQQAALKLVKRGIDTDEIARRFVQERQILASLEHPHIARLFDGGVSDDGRPYFVMEYIDGAPIDQWCDECSATVEARLALFLDVASAVEHAHRKLVVHRDIKPGNVLVDATGRAKLLDFGIAKLLDPTAALRAPETRTAVRVMTPEYASPEQVRGEPATVASDVYQLGLLLYELLTGRRAHRLEGKSLTEIERVVCTEMPPRPSTAVVNVKATDGSSPGGATTVTSIGREGLRRRLRGDLDNIVLLALRKEPDARYPTAAALIEDLNRHLTGRPVVARRPTFGYLAGRFVKRHVAAVTAAALVAASLVAGLSATLWQARIARAERDHARREATTAGRVSDFLIDTFEISDPGEARGSTVTARELLDSGTGRIESLRDEPEIQATLKDVMGRVYQSLGLYERAQGLIASSLDMRRSAASGPDGGVAASLDHMGLLDVARGSYDDAEQHLRAGLEMRRALFGPVHVEVAESLQNLAHLEHIRNHLDAAGALLDEALGIRNRLPDPDPVEIATLNREQAMLWLQRGQPEQARTLLEHALEAQRASLGEHLVVAATLNSLGMVAQNQDRVADAGRYYDECLALRTKILGATHPETSRTRNNLAALYYQQRDYKKAAPIFRDNVEAQRQTLGDDHPTVATSRDNYGVVLSMLGEYDAAEPQLRESLRIRLAKYGEDHPSVAAGRYHLGRMLRDKGEPKEAEALMRRALASLGPKDLNLPGCRLDLGELYLAQGRLAEAAALLEAAVRSSGELNGAEHWFTAATRSARGGCSLKRGDTRAAKEDLEFAWGILEKRPPDDKRRKLALERMLELYRATGDEANAAKTLERMKASS